jgi:hypothetical protein
MRTNFQKMKRGTKAGTGGLGSGYSSVSPYDVVDVESRPGYVSSHSNVKTDIDDVLQHYNDEIERIIGKTNSHLIAADRVVQDRIRDATTAIAGNGSSNSSSSNTNTNKWQTARPRNEHTETMPDTDDDDDDAGEHVQLLSQPSSQGIRSLFGMKTLVGVVQTQCLEYQTQLQSSADTASKANIRNIALQSHVDDLEGDIESIKLYQKKLEAELKARSSSASSQGPRHRHVANSLDNSQAALMKNDNLRQALLSLEDTADVSITIEKLRQQGILRTIADVCYGWFQYFLPLKQELKEIESKFGSSIVSYFLFCRFILMQFIAVAVVTIIFVGFHISAMLGRGKGISAIVESHGTLPHFMFMSSYAVSENVDYSLLIVLIVLMLTISTIEKVIREDRSSKEAAAIENENSSPYATEVFGAWDFSQRDRQQVEATHGILAQSYAVMLASSDRADRISKRTRNEVIMLWARRCTVMFTYVVVQLLAIVVFLYLSFYADTVIQKASKYSELKPISRYIQSLTFQAISTAMPMIADTSTQFEKWDSGHVELLISTARNYLSNTVNTLVVAIAFYVFADPMLFANSGLSTLRKIAMSESVSLPCRLDHVADSVFTLILTTCISDLLSFVAMPFARYLKAQLFPNSSNQTTPQKQFDVADNIVNRLLFIGVLFLLVPFAPLALMLAPVFIYVIIKWQTHWILVCYRKPKKPWKAHQAMPLFSLFYLVTLLLLCVMPSFYFLTTKTFAKDCGIQDRYTHLCVSGTLDTASYVCQLDSHSTYYRAYQSASYPADICSNSCGAFVQNSNSFDSVKQELYRSYAVQVIWEIAFSYSYLPWIVCVMLCIVVALMRNSIRIGLSSAVNKDKIYEAKIISLEAELAVTGKKLGKLQAIDDSSRNLAVGSLDDHHA